MFTGIIEEVGQIQAIKPGVLSAQLIIKANVVLGDVKLGDSIAINGVCLTVTHYDQNSFRVDAVPETMKRSNLGNLKAGDHVNLERALAVGDRLGGHMVSGHVDATGTILHIEKEENAVWYTIEMDSEMIKYLIPKGSVAVDGISLTVVDVEKHKFTLSVIPHSLANTTLVEKVKGDNVNIECDMTAKYIDRFLSWKTEEKKDVSMDLLRRNGFL